jgi:hypothetical protein
MNTLLLLLLLVVVVVVVVAAVKLFVYIEPTSQLFRD